MLMTEPFSWSLLPCTELFKASEPVIWASGFLSILGMPSLHSIPSLPITGKANSSTLDTQLLEQSY